MPWEGIICALGGGRTVSWLNRTAGVYRARNTTGQIFNSSSRKTDGASIYSWPCFRWTNPGAILHEPQTTADDQPQKKTKLSEYFSPKTHFLPTATCSKLTRAYNAHVNTLHMVTIVHALCWWYHSLAHHQPNYTLFLPLARLKFNLLSGQTKQLTAFFQEVCVWNTLLWPLVILKFLINLFAFAF